MSSESQPISAERFAAALFDLPLSSVHAKAAEIQNSIAHLKQSNNTLQQYADDGDKDCQEAIDENQVVIDRQLERVALLKEEVERRGFKWADTDLVNGTSDADMVAHVITESNTEQQAETAGTASGATARGGSLTDEELTRRLAERMDEDEDGVHL